MAATIKEHIEVILEEASIDRNYLIDLKDIPAANLIPGMVKAAKRIIRVLRRKKRNKVLIVGDYDCDGIMATAIAMSFWRETEFKNQVDYIVPDRFIDGYGVSINMIDYAVEHGFSLIYTVDNGIGAKYATDYAEKMGVEVIITDHHTPGDQVPNVDIIVDLKYDQGKFPFQEITGATISWYLCCQIREELDLQIDMRRWIDLVGITVISDVMPLKDINLIFYNYAIKAIRARTREIYKIVYSPLEAPTLTETDIGFRLVPMINAVGRIDHAKYAVDLFLATERTAIKKGVKYLISVNNKRKVYTQQLLDLVLPEAEKQMKSGAKTIIIRNRNLHEGIVGIIAGKLAERFNRPSFVFGWNRAKDCWKGSGRTSGSVDLYKLICNGNKFSLGFGGHVGAVGVAIAKDNFEGWFDLVNTAASDIPEAIFYTNSIAPLEVQLSAINEDLLDSLNKFRPFGQEFVMPEFKAKVLLTVQDSYKEGLHWKCLLSDRLGNSMTAFFFHDKTIDKYNQKEIEVIFSPERKYSEKGFNIELNARIPYSEM